MVEEDSKACREVWWQNLIYLNNVLPNKKACCVQSWYLAVDMQFFIVSIWVVHLVWKRRRSGLTLLGLLTVASVLVSGIVL